MSTATILMLACLLLGAPPVAAGEQGSEPMTVEAMRNLGRAGLIDLATDRLRSGDAGFDPTAYDQVVVSASSSDVMVSFATSIVLLRVGERFTHGRSIALVSGAGSGGIVANPHDLPWSGDAPPFVPDAADRVEIAFVIDAVNRDPDVGSIPDGKLPLGTGMIIRDAGDHYAVSVADEWMDSSYHVAKDTGAISEAMHAHSVPPPVEPGAELFEIVSE